RRFGRRTALLATSILATCPLFFGLSQALITDMLLTLCMTATFIAVLNAERASNDEAVRRRWILLGALGAAAGVLTKGPVALVLPLAVAAMFFVSQRDRATLRALLDWRAIALFVAVASPWFVLVSIRNPEFPHFFFVEQNVDRFARGTVGHPEGPLFYI